MAYKSTIKEIISLLEASAHPDLKRPFYFGDPLHVPESLLPTVSVDIETGESPLGPTGHDEQTQRLMIKVLVNKKHDLKKAPKEVVATRKLIEYVEEIDENTGQYKTNTILGILRKNLTLESTSIGNDISWEYGVVEREDVLTAEAWITISVSKNIEVSNRS